MSHTPPPGIATSPDPELEAVPTPVADDPLTPFPTLTPREREVAQMLVRGLKNSEIAEAMGTSVKTIDTHRGHVLKKLKLRNNVELTRYAFRHGWTSAVEDES